LVSVTLENAELRSNLMGSYVPKIVISFLCVFLVVLSPIVSLAAEPSEPTKVATGVGSMPALLLPDGTVCTANTKESSLCKEVLFRLPDEMMNESYLTFYGIFDLDNDGSPEVFLDYWPGEEVVYLLVYKKVGSEYSLYLKLEAESHGYAPGAWFLQELPSRKALFMTRRCGSGGMGLFYLDLKKGSLELINSGICAQDYPMFEDLDRDGLAEIFIQGRGRDRFSIQGAGLFHWRENTYKLWWPDWTSPPYVIYANLANLHRVSEKEIVAVLEPGNYSDDLYEKGELLGLRELGIWKYTQNTFTLVDKVRLPNSKRLGYPDLQILPASGGNEIVLEYEDNTVRCIYLEGKIVCPETKRR
jgi:hypothetical protein